MLSPQRFDERLDVKPMTFYPEQRREAVALAADLGRGVRMEVHNAHTEFWADPDVPIGKIDAWAAKTYSGPIEYEATLDSPDEEWTPGAWK